VREGDWIATSGSTGQGSGPHLHFSIKSGSAWGTATQPEPMGGTSVTGFGNYGYSQAVSCGWNGRGPRYFAVAPAVAVTSRRWSGAYYLDGYGGINPSNGAPALPWSAPWSGWNIARDFKLCPRNDASGFLLDGWGGIHPIGNAPSSSNNYGSPYWQWDIGRAIAIYEDCQSGYVLDGWGGIHPFAANGVLPPAVPEVLNDGYYPNRDIVVALVIENPTGTRTNPGSGFTLDIYGGIHPFGSAPRSTNNYGIPYWGWDIARAMVLTVDVPWDCCSGYVLDGWGGVHQFGPGAAVPTYSSYRTRWDIARGISVTGVYIDSYAPTYQVAAGYYVDMYNGMNTWSEGGAVP